MGWINDKLGVIRSRGKLGFFGWVLGKVLGSLGLGMLLVGYFPSQAWISVGWVLIVLSLVVSMPSVKAMFSRGY